MWNAVVQGLGLFGLGLFVLFASLNWAMVLSNLLKRGRRACLVPFVGGLGGVLGFAAIPALRPYLWAPPLLDVGTALFLGDGLPYLLWELWRTSTFNLLSEYRGGNETKEVRIRLFRTGVFVLVQTLRKRKEELGLRGISFAGEWSQTNHQIQLQVGERIAVFQLGDAEGGVTLRQVSGFPANAELSLEGVELRLTFSRTCRA